jgi:hypothetical protein
MRRYLPLVLLAACSGPDHQEAVFAGRTDTQIDRAVVAVTGGDLFMATFMAVIYEHTPAGQCPSVTQDAQGRAHVQGGCTTSDGTQLTGAAIIDNVPDASGKNADPTRPGTLQFEQLTITQAAGTTSFDGTLELDGNGAIASLDVGFGGIVAHDDFSYHCDTQCTYDAGSMLDVDGIGTADVSGTFTLTSPQQVMLTLRGADELDLQDRNGCVAYSGAATGMLCAKQ